ncbi:ricin-type beta-trefoil lectin domain protein [Streptomyces sp. CA2R101]|uniref:ricin-type beta-trefoil lectin domain protein n=1 Tax=Streptomyces sp. CA2R101 TaxID=3120152 RepID=UPI00300BB870
MMKRSFGMAVAGLAVAGLSTLGAASASAAPVQGFNIKNVVAKKCLKFNGFDKRVTAVKCNTGDARQNWSNYPGDQIISAYVNPAAGPCLATKKNSGGNVYAKKCTSDPNTWSMAWSVNSFHDGEKAIYGNGLGRCFLKVSGGNAVCTPGHTTEQKWWVADYN